MFPMVTRLLVIERVMFQVPLNTFLDCFEKCGHSFKTLDFKRLGKSTQNWPQRRLGSDDVQHARFWRQFCSKTHEIFPVFLIVTKLLLFSRDVFEVPSNMFLHFFATSGLSRKTFDSKRSTKIRKTSPKGGWSQMRLIALLLGTIVVCTSNDGIF